MRPKRVNLNYNDASELDGIPRFESTGSTNSAGRTAYDYDGAGRISQVTHRRPDNTVLVAYYNTYDTAGRISTVQSMADGTATYTYDKTDQLLTATYTSQPGTPQPNEIYDFDANGSRESVPGVSSHTTQHHNRLAADSNYDYGYDREGNVASRWNRGNEYIKYVYDHRNRLERVEYFASPAAGRFG